jgi:hypothetical protein
MMDRTPDRWRTISVIGIYNQRLDTRPWRAIALRGSGRTKPRRSVLHTADGDTAPAEPPVAKAGGSFLLEGPFCSETVLLWG